MDAPLAPPDRCRAADRDAYERFFVVLVALFIAALVACNLIFKKFFAWELPFGLPFLPYAPEQGNYVFIQSVGLLPYPLTFLVTDLMSEVYGKKRANRVVMGGVVASVFVVGLLALADAATASEISPIQDDVFAEVFGQAWVPFAASMGAYLVAQLLDIRLFHFWRRATNGKHLWLRNNASTVCSQVLDTVLVLALLAQFGDAFGWESVPALIVNGVLFKVLVAFLDTPLFYLGVYYARRRFGPLIDEAHREDTRHFAESSGRGSSA